MDKNKIESILNDAKQSSDELKVKLHLGKADLKEEFEEMQASYDVFRSKMHMIGDIVGDTAEEMHIAKELGIEGDTEEDRKIAYELAAEEFKAGFEKIKKLL